MHFNIYYVTPSGFGLLTTIFYNHFICFGRLNTAPSGLILQNIKSNSERFADQVEWQNKPWPLRR